MTAPTPAPDRREGLDRMLYEAWRQCGYPVMPFPQCVTDRLAIALAATSQADQWQVRADDDDETLWTLAATPQADPAPTGLRAAAEAIRDHHAAPFAVNGHSLTDDCWSRFYVALAAAEPDGLDALFDSIIDEYELAVGETFDRAHVKARWYARLRESGDD